jgi:hypothetical protein
MAKLKIAPKDKPEKDAVYLLKIILFFLLGCLWIRFNGAPIPIGLLFGIILAMHEHFMIDRKIEYMVLILATILSFVTPIGFVLDIG